MNPVLQVRGLLIDMDGLLLDTERIAEGCWLQAEMETGIILPAGFYHTLIGQSMARVEERLREIIETPGEVEAFLKVANRVYHNAVLEGDIPVKAGAAELLEYLASTNVPRCLATSTGRDLCDQKLISTGLAQWIPQRVAGDEVRHSKPAPDIYLAAAEKLGIAPAELLVLEDSENGLRAALAAGCRAVHLPDLGPVALEVQLQVDRVYRDLREVLSALQGEEIKIDLS